MSRISRHMKGEGYNELHVAVEAKNEEEVNRLLSEDPSIVNSTMENGETALHIVAQLGYTKLLGVLIEHRGDLSARDEDDHTPLHDCLQQVYFESEGA